MQDKSVDNEQVLQEDVVALLLAGKRPEGMGFEEFRIKRAAVQSFLKRKAKGRFIYVSKELSTIQDENGDKKDVIKSYGPYKKQKDE